MTWPEDFVGEIVQGHVLGLLRPLPDNSVQMVVTSPPYWHLRDYKIEPLVWGGAPMCRHAWGEERIKTKSHAQQDNGPGGGVWNARTRGQDQSSNRTEFLISRGNFCALCGAWRGSLGLEPTIDLYVSHMVEIFREVRRVLRPDGTLWLNMGDSYASGKGTCFNPGGGDNSLGHDKKESGAHPLDRGNISTLSAQGLKPKDLCGIPWRVAFALQADGWYLRSEIIWHKPNPMPGSQPDRPTVSHENIFLLSKSGKKLYWTHRTFDGVRIKPAPDYRWRDRKTFEETAIEPPDAWDKDKWQRINLWRGHDYFYDAEAIKEPSVTNDIRRPYGSQGAKEMDGRPAEQWHGGEPRCFKGSKFNTGKTAIHQLNRSSSLPRIHGNLPGRDDDGAACNGPGQETRNRRSVWTITTQPFKGAHFATFPQKLVEPCILAGTSERGCCEKCGAPWERVVESTRSFESGVGRAGNLPVGKQNGRLQGGGETIDIRRGPVVSSNTLGWRPTCACNARTVPCVVLDPFMGAGTVAVVAERLGRSWLGFELNPEYVEMANQRIEAVKKIICEQGRQQKLAIALN